MTELTTEWESRAQEFSNRVNELEEENEQLRFAVNKLVYYVQHAAFDILADVDQSEWRKLYEEFKLLAEKIREEENEETID